MMNIKRLFSYSRSLGLRSSLLVLCLTCAPVALFVYSSRQTSEVQAAPVFEKRQRKNRARTLRPREEAESRYAQGRSDNKGREG
jgi:hypothetical protein